MLYNEGTRQDGARPIILPYFPRLSLVIGYQSLELLGWSRGGPIRKKPFILRDDHSGTLAG